jgi:hypothetical protein
VQCDSFNGSHANLNRARQIHRSTYLRKIERHAEERYRHKSSNRIGCGLPETEWHDFVFRYCSPSTHNPNKSLTANEAAALSAANLEIGVIFEDSPKNVTVAYFTNAGDQQDGTNAWNFTQTVGQPAGSCVYFAVDFDAAPEEIDAILDYFRGVQAGMNTAAGGASAYAIGVYGSGIVLPGCETG